MHFAIVEDLKTDRENLAALLEGECAAHHVSAEFSMYSNAEDFLAEFRRGFCSAVFLDVMLGDGMNGVEAAHSLRALDEEMPIIFTTTERDFALDSYSVHALDFLVKPVQPEKLSWCMGRLWETEASPEYLEVRIMGTDVRSVISRYIPLNDIIDTETISRKCVVHTTDGDIFTMLSHGEVMSMLPRTGRFCEYARGMCVNLAFVVSVSMEGNIVLKDGRQLFCSRRKIKDTVDAYRNYQFAQLRGKGI